MNGDSSDADGNAHDCGGSDSDYHRSLDYLRRALAGFGPASRGYCRETRRYFILFSHHNMFAVKPGGDIGDDLDQAALR